MNEPQQGDRVTAHLWNFDGRWNDIEAGVFPPDVDDPGEIIVGTLLITTRPNLWGTRTDWYVTQENGLTQLVEPETVQVIREGDGSAAQ